MLAFFWVMSINNKMGRRPPKRPMNIQGGLHEICLRFRHASAVTTSPLIKQLPHHESGLRVLDDKVHQFLALEESGRNLMTTSRDDFHITSAA